MMKRVFVLLFIGGVFLARCSNMKSEIKPLESKDTFLGVEYRFEYYYLFNPKLFVFDSLSISRPDNRTMFYQVFYNENDSVVGFILHARESLTYNVMLIKKTDKETIYRGDENYEDTNSKVDFWFFSDTVNIYTMALDRQEDGFIPYAYRMLKTDGYCRWDVNFPDRFFKINLDSQINTTYELYEIIDGALKEHSNKDFFKLISCKYNECVIEPNNSGKITLDSDIFSLLAIY